MTGDEIKAHLRNAATLKPLVTMSKARRLSAEFNTMMERAGRRGSPREGEVLALVTLRPDGTEFGDNPAELEAADSVEPTLVSLGRVGVYVVQEDATPLAVAVGAIDASADDRACVLAQFEPGEQQPAAGQFVVLDTGVLGVKLTFVVWITGADAAAESPFAGAAGVRNPALASLTPNRALLVQQLPGEEPA